MCSPSVCIGAYIHGSAHKWRSQDIYKCRIHSFFRGSATGQGLTYSSRPAVQGVQGMLWLCLPSAEVTGMYHHALFFSVDTRDRNWSSCWQGKHYTECTTSQILQTLVLLGMVESWVWVWLFLYRKLAQDKNSILWLIRALSNQKEEPSSEVPYFYWPDFSEDHNTWKNLDSQSLWTNSHRYRDTDNYIRN